MDALREFLEGLADGRPMTLPGTGADLDPTLSRVADEMARLRLSEEKYRLVTENISVGIIVVQDGLFRYLNPMACEITGYTPTEMLGREFAPLVHPEDLPVVADRHMRRMRGDTVEPRYDFRVLRRDGSIVWVQLAAVPIPWEGALATLSFINDITDRKRAELALQRSEQRYRTLINAAPKGMGIVIVRRNLVMLANPAMQEILGRTQDELAALGSFLDVVHGPDRPLMAGVARVAVDDPAGQVTTFRVVTQDGRVTWVEGNSVQIDWEGKPATLAYIRDISARKVLEEKVANALAERETMLENSVVGIAFLNAAGRLRWANKPMGQIFGSDVAAQVGSSLEPYYLSRDDYLRVGGDVVRAVSEGRTHTEEVRMRRVDGTLFWVYLSGRAVNANDLSRGTVWVVMDISRRKELEEDLRRKTSEQEAILQSTQIGITYSVDRVHQWCNATFAEMLGYTMDELVGSSSEIHFPDRAAWQALGGAAYPLLARGEAYSGELQMLRKDEELIWVQLHGKAIDPADPERGSIWTFVDITQRHKAEEDIRRALDQQRELNELKSRFVSMTSHEFRTPLATILSSAELLRHYSDRLPASERLEILDSVESSVQRMTQMLDGILMIGRSDAGMLEFRPLPLAPGELVRQLANEAALAAGGDSATRLVVNAAVGLEPCLLDEKLLRHIVGNLVGNALKYSPDGGEVRVDVAVSEQELSITVSDSGIGIPEADLSRLFETFHRAGNTGTISGTGLGLAIVKRAVERHGGRVVVSSHPGRGTMFSVELPALGAGRA